MKWIVITQPQAFEHEAEYIAKLLSYGVDYIHLRKPDMAVGEFESLLQSIPESLHPRLTLHDHFSLAESYRVGGLHLNSRQSTLPDSFHGRVSRSCHSLEEVVRCRDGVEYLFLSPIFDSISKRGYSSAFTPCQMQEASAKGLIDKKVIALGGVRLENIPSLRQLGFGGVAQIGDIWQRIDDESYLREIRQAL